MNISVITEPIVQYLRSQPIDKAWLFGSYSRNEATPESDIDIMVRYANPDSISLMTIARMTVALERITGHDIDLVEEGCLTAEAQTTANNDKILIYERENL